MLQRLRNYFAPEACAKRRLERERETLMAEQRGIKAMRTCSYAREFEIENRLLEIKNAELPKPAVERRASDAAHVAQLYAMYGKAATSVIEDDACLNESWLHGVASEVRP